MDENKETEITEEASNRYLIDVELDLGIKELDEKIAKILAVREELNELTANILDYHLPKIKISIK